MGGHNIERIEEFTCIDVKVDFCQEYCYFWHPYHVTVEYVTGR